MRTSPRTGRLVALVVLVALQGPVRAPAASFWIGGWADPDRAAPCTNAEPGATVRHTVWAYVLPAGAAYVTIRFRFPDNLAATGPPDLAPAVTRLIVTPFADGTSEWNLLLTGCPAGWVPLLGQDFTVLDAEPATVGIVAHRSMVRDCGFVLHDVEVANQLGVNTPGCEVVAAETPTWGGLKSRYR